MISCHSLNVSSSLYYLTVRVYKIKIYTYITWAYAGFPKRGPSFLGSGRDACRKAACSVYCSHLLASEVWGMRPREKSLNGAM